MAGDQATSIETGDSLDLTIVICTRNRGSKLGALFSSLSLISTSRQWEILLIDNNSTDDTGRVISEAGNLGGRMRSAMVDRIGLGAARDAAWRLARGSIIAFTDDDCYLAAGYVDSMLAVFEEDPKLDYVGGRITLYDPDDIPVTIDLRTERSDIRPRTFVPAGALQGANFAFRRHVLDAIGGIDADMGAGTPFPAEDIDAAAAAAWAGFRGVYDPRPVVAHHHGRKAADLPALMRGYDRGRGAYYAKYLLRPDSRRSYFYGWRDFAIRYPHRGSLWTLWREYLSGCRYILHRRRFAFLPRFAGMAILIAVAIVSRIVREKISNRRHPS